MPTETQLPTDFSLLAGLGITNIEPYETANTPIKSVGTRREWRIKQSTGELRGISVRKRDKDRESVGWFDKRSPGWKSILAEYEAWRRKPRYAVGTFEQSAGEYDSQQAGESVGNLSE